MMITGCKGQAIIHYFVFIRTKLLSRVLCKNKSCDSHIYALSTAEDYM